jgi:hypothetical protein
VSGPVVVYLAPMGRAHWPDPIGIRLATRCSGARIGAWDMELPQDVPREQRCQHRGCARAWAAFDQDNGPPTTPDGSVTPP